jgi:hypothetical protein
MSAEQHPPAEQPGVLDQGVDARGSCRQAARAKGGAADRLADGAGNPCDGPKIRNIADNRLLRRPGAARKAEQAGG